MLLLKILSRNINISGCLLFTATMIVSSLSFLNSFTIEKEENASACSTSSSSVFSLMILEQKIPLLLIYCLKMATQFCSSYFATTEQLEGISFDLLSQLYFSFVNQRTLTFLYSRRSYLKKNDFAAENATGCMVDSHSFSANLPCSPMIWLFASNLKMDLS